MFQPKDKVVFPGHGVAVIDSIIEKVFSGVKTPFFKLKFLYKDMTVLIPVQGPQVKSVMRPLSGQRELQMMFKILQIKPKKLETTDFTPSSWNKRNKMYQLKIQGGDLHDIAHIYRDLMYTAQYKELSFGEKNLLDTAEELLVQEIQSIQGQETRAILDMIRSPFKHCEVFTAPELRNVDAVQL